MTKAWKRGSAALAAGAIIAVGMVATQPAPSASAAKGTTATKPVVPTKIKTVRLMVCDKGAYTSVYTVRLPDPQDRRTRIPAYYKAPGDKCVKSDLYFNKTYRVSVKVLNVKTGKRGATIKTFTFKADRPMTVVTLGTAQKPHLERYRK
ncbi:hypothetical protein [Streptomyces zaomyceticus]|uniref:hypothetical protein n=1 Tax=Streptomyces zaomyceticus TaxID=68286 RepID=UPI0036AC1099